MKKSTAVSLKTVLGIIAAITLFSLIKFPLTEGRAAKLDLLSIYADPLILFVYASSAAFFYGIYQAIRVTDFLSTSKTPVSSLQHALYQIQMCCAVLIACIASALAYIRFFLQGEDAAGPSMLGLITMLALAAVLTLVGRFQKRFAKPGSKQAR